MESSMAQMLSKWLVVIVVAILISTMLLSVKKYYFDRDYLLYIKATCNPSVEKCFVHECDEGDVRCEGDNEAIQYYKILYKKENQMMFCAGNDCLNKPCSNNLDCFVRYCSTGALLELKLPDTCSS